MLHAHDERSVVASCTLEFKCQKCNESSETDAFRFRTVGKLYGFIPVWVTHETALQCPSCNTTFRTKLAPSDLLALPQEQLARSFRVRIGFVEKFLVIAGWLVVFVGPVSLIMFLVAYFRISTAAAGWRRASAIGIGVSGVVTSLMALSIILGI